MKKAFLNVERCQSMCRSSLFTLTTLAACRSTRSTLHALYHRRLALNMNLRVFFQTAAPLALLFTLTVRAGDWPQFRGPLGNGVAQEYHAAIHWGPTNNLRWKATLTGPGNSSPIVSHGHVFVACAEVSG